MSECDSDLIDVEVEKLKRARSSPAVLKLKLAKLRSEDPNVPIFAFEGDDDKIIYYQWVRRSKPEMSYESFPCNGKDQLLALLDSVRDDMTGLADAVYFFVDRDFDELKGRSPGDDVFVTEHYSVENYLVSSDVLEEILKIEFHCHANKETRDEIIKIFNRTYDEFLELTRGINKRLFVARVMGASVKPLPEKINRIAKVNLLGVEPGTQTDAEVVEFRDVEPVPQPEVIAAFERLDGRERYRGKFALMFFIRWLDELAEQARAPDRGVFARVDNRSAVRRSEVTLTSLASKSALPAGLSAFIGAVTPACA